MIPRNVLPVRKTTSQLAFDYQGRLVKKFGKSPATFQEVLAAVRHEGSPTSLLEEIVAAWLEDDRRTGITIID